MSNQVNAAEPVARAQASPAEDAPCGESRRDGASRGERPSVVAYFNAEHARHTAGDEDARLDVASGDASVDCVADAGDCIYPDDIDDWAERFEVTPEQLRAAMRRVGARADDVARYLANPDVV